MSKKTALFDEMGGEQVLRPLMDAFVERMVADDFIGFFFKHVALKRLKALEFPYAAQILGASDIVYGGRDLRCVHQPLGIMPGQFQRRLLLLRKTLEDFQISEAVAKALLQHSEDLASSVIATSKN